MADHTLDQTTPMTIEPNAIMDKTLVDLNLMDPSLTDSTNPLVLLVTKTIHQFIALIAAIITFTKCLILLFVVHYTTTILIPLLVCTL